MKALYTKSLLLALATILLITSCNKNDVQVNPESISPTARKYSGEPVRNYFTLMCRVAKNTPGFFPPQVARAYGYIGIAAYESVVHGIPNAKSLSGQLNGLNQLPKPAMNVEYNWAISSNAAIAEELRKMFDKNLSSASASSIDSLESANLNALSSGVSMEVVNRSIAFGYEIANAIYQYSRNDNGHESYLDPFQLPYELAIDDFCWVPTGTTLQPISPYWGNNRPFISDNVEHTQPEPHITFSNAPNSEFYNIALEVYNQVKNNTNEQVEITKYWADDPFATCTPAGHTFNIMIQLLQEDDATLEKTSVAFAKLSIAENDAFITCWKGKYDYVLIRPVSYIQKYIDPNFQTVRPLPQLSRSQWSWCSWPSSPSSSSASASSSEMAAIWAGVPATSPPGSSSSCGRKVACTATVSSAASSSTMTALPGPSIEAGSPVPSAPCAEASTSTASSRQWPSASSRSPSLMPAR